MPAAEPADLALDAALFMGALLRPGGRTSDSNR